MKKFLLKLNNIVLVIAILLSCFSFPTKAKAASSYNVSVLDQSGVIEELGTFTNYNDAEAKMLAYPSTETKTAVIYSNGKIVSARYALVRFYTGTGTLNLYKNEYDSGAYTYTHPDYGVEAAFIDYNGGSRVKLMLSGFIGWADLSRLDVVPLPILQANTLTPQYTDIRVRTEPNSSSDIIGHLTVYNTYAYYDKVTNDGYTWYKISYDDGYGWVADNGIWYNFSSGTTLQTYYNPYTSGNLIHYYMYSGGQGFTNLGPRPSYLNIGTRYYSFDGNYFYTSLTKMLDDYRTGTYKNALNANDPFYAYYLYLSNHSTTNYTASDLDGIITRAGFTSGVIPGVKYYDIATHQFLVDVSGKSVMYGTGQDFIDVGNDYGINAFSAFTTALNESDNGTSEIAFAKFNIFGLGANDSDPMGGAHSYATVKDSIIEFAQLTGSKYSNPNGSLFFGSFYGNKGSGMNVKYASDPYWGEKQAMDYYLNDNKYGLQDFNSNTLGIKQTDEAIPLKAEPSNSSRTIYTLKNKSFNVGNMAYIVFDKVYTEENGVKTGWYKVYTDTSLDENRNLNHDAPYRREYSYGYIREDYLYVKNKQPIITASDFSLKKGSKYNLLDYVSASDPEEGKLVETLDVYSTNLKIDEPGVYQVTYVVRDSMHFYAYKTVNVTVTGSNAPTITLLKDEVTQYTSVNLKDLVKVTDYDGTDLKGSLKVSGSINMDVVGDNKITYTVTNKLGKTTTVAYTIKVIANAKPVINATDKTIVVGSEFNPLEGVTASDKEDGPITKIEVIYDDVKEDTPGTYKVTYKVTDKANQSTEKTITVTVSNKKQVDGSFYFDYLDKKDGNLEFRGYLTISGMNNTLKENIKYKLIFVNTDDSSLTYEQEISRITDLTGINRPIYSPDGFTYTHAWFKGNIDIEALPVGNYIMYVQAESDTTFSKALVNNSLYSTEIASYEGKTKAVNIKNNYSDRTSAVTLYIREKGLPLKSVGTYYNQFDTWRNFEFVDNKLHLKGVSYSYGMKLGANDKVTRTIIFENQDTFETYSFDLGSITDGMYNVALPVSDNLDKTRAWYDKNIDISSIPKGEYVIYISTSSNVTDISELTDLMNSDLSNVKATIDGKNYSFKINLDKGNRIEMLVK